MEISKIPTHVSIIMDGNGRWAQARGLNRSAGHVEGVESIRAVTEACVEAGVKYVSFYAFSEENWGRPEEEVIKLMELMMLSMQNEEQLFMNNRVRFRILGNRERLGERFNSIAGHFEELTAANDGLTFILFISYSGKWDILQAARKFALACGGDPERIAAAGFDDFDRLLVTGGVPDPDLLIRTSGEKRLSNYLLWQCAYTEFYFTETLWPDFRKEQFMEALAAYAARDRRYGKVK